MSPDFFSRRSRKAAVSGEALAERGAALKDALESGAGTFPDADVADARRLVDKVEARTGVAGGRTVVALAGATGSGKSSLFNALVGEPVSRIGARRPTTSRAAAAVWGQAESGDLLDWLNVGLRHQVPPAAPDADTLDGLVLLDLPDFDSRVAEHRAEADRVLELADVFVWVTDPQKYADAVMHEEYISRTAGHDAVTIVVLNQVDRLPRGSVEECVADLRGLLDRDGLGDVALLTTSASKGVGIDALTTAIGDVVQRQNAAEHRLMADLRACARRLQGHVGEGEPDVAPAQEGLTDALGKAAAVPVVRTAVERDYERSAIEHGGWPFTRWVGKLRPAPLSRLGLDKVANSLTRSEGRMVLGKSSLPPATPAALAAVDLATRRLSEEASDGLPPAWADQVHEAASPDDSDLRDALDQAVLRTPLRDRDPKWWSVVAGLQWLFAATAIAGLLWLVVLFVLGFFQIRSTPPTWGFLPAPLMLLVVGILLGLLTAFVTRRAARVGARRRGEQVENRLHGAVAQVGDARVVTPVREVLGRHRAVREALATSAA